MVLRRVLLSADDEVNVALFNGFAAEGLAYGTKEGRLRVLKYDRCVRTATAVVLKYDRCVLLLQYLEHSCCVPAWARAVYCRARRRGCLGCSLKHCGSCIARGSWR